MKRTSQFFCFTDTGNAAYACTRHGRDGQCSGDLDDGHHLWWAEGGAHRIGKEIKLDSPAFIENDRTYTPIRFISENLGASVEWVEKDQKVIITKPKIKKAETK